MWAILRSDFFVGSYAMLPEGNCFPYNRVPAAPVPTVAIGREMRYLGCTEMLCEITVGPSYLKADLFNRQTAEEARDALAAIAAEARKHACAQILISVHASRPLFKVEQYGIPDYFKGPGEN